MLISNASAFEYVQYATPKITALCVPFLKNFGLTTFIYSRHYYDGSYIFLSNYTDWIKNWFDTVHTIKNTIFETNFRKVSPDAPLYFLWDAVPLSEFIQMNNDFGLWHGFDIYYRLEDSIEGWSFSTLQERQEIDNFYFNNLKLFHRFCLCLKKDAKTLFNIKDKKNLAIYAENCEFSFQPSTSQFEEIDNLLSSLVLNGCSLQTNRGEIILSKRELDCMVYFSQGKTTKEIGRLLNINPRTVEVHFMNIKQKTGYYNKSILADIMRENILQWI